MPKIKLNEHYPSIEINLGMGNILRKDEIKDFPDSYELRQALGLGYVEIVKEEKKEEKKLKKGNEVWVFAEQRNNKISKVVFELLGIARNLAEKLSVEVASILLCEKDNALSKELAAYGADRVYLAEDRRLKDYHTDIYAKIISDLINKHKPQIVLYGATLIGRDLAPRIAQKISTGLTADCTGLDIDEDGLLLQTRPAFGGNIMAQIKCKTKPQMATVRPGVMEILPENEKREGSVIKISPEIVESKVRIIDMLKSAKKKVNLEEANIIVSGGRGLCKKENLEIVKKLAELLGAEVGASRAVVDAGWLQKEQQVGQTGKTVRPKLYIACGISGAIQHRVGMQNSKTIIAINKDPNAMIFKIADYGVVGDVREIIPALIEELEIEKSM